MSCEDVHNHPVPDGFCSASSHWNSPLVLPDGSTMTHATDQLLFAEVCEPLARGQDRVEDLRRVLLRVQE